MNPEQQKLVSGYLDSTLTEGEEAELNAWIKASPEHAALLAKMVRFHDHLHGIIQTRPLDMPKPAKAEETVYAASATRSWRRIRLVGALGALAALVFITFWWSHPPQVNAAPELDRLIENASHGGDRTYRIRNLDTLPEQFDDRRPPIDGATLHVRQPDQYVLIRKFPNGSLLVTGSDGKRSWSSPPTGAVRLSGDPLRFRGPVPGNQHGIPFVNLRSDLVQLRDAYVVTPLGLDAAGYRGLLAMKKSTDYRGPNRVELWYDATTGVIQRMVFAGMPKARGGPDCIAVDLLEQRELGNDFFQHETHHAADRRVIEED